MSVYSTYSICGQTYVRTRQRMHEKSVSTNTIADFVKWSDSLICAITVHLVGGAVSIMLKKEIDGLVAALGLRHRNTKQGSLPCGGPSLLRAKIYSNMSLA